MIERTISSKLILRLLRQLQRSGCRQLLEQLEVQEPDFAEFIMEELSGVHHELWAAGINDKLARQLYRRIEQLVLTAILSLREAQNELLSDLHGPDADDNR